MRSIFLVSTTRAIIQGPWRPHRFHPGRGATMGEISRLACQAPQYHPPISHWIFRCLHRVNPSRLVSVHWVRQEVSSRPRVGPSLQSKR
jgi:hypothetical protein